MLVFCVVMVLIALYHNSNPNFIHSLRNSSQAERQSWVRDPVILPEVEGTEVTPEVMVEIVVEVEEHFQTEIKMKNWTLLEKTVMYTEEVVIRGEVHVVEVEEVRDITPLKCTLATECMYYWTNKNNLQTIKTTIY